MRKQFGEETTFLFGPTLEEQLGRAIKRLVSLEFGSFQLVHLGSKPLQNDVGFVAGIAIKL